MKVKDAYLVGSYGVKSTGDDAVLAGALWGVRQLKNMEHVIISTPRELALDKHCSIPSSLPLIQKFKGHERLQHYANAVHSDRIVFGGVVLNNERELSIYCHMMALASSDLHMAVGVRIEPFTDRSTEKACERFLKACHYIRVSDYDSLVLAKELAPEADIRLSFDLMPLLLCHQWFNIKPLKRSGIAVCMRPVDVSNSDISYELERCEIMASTLKAYYRMTGESVALIDMDGDVNSGDCMVHEYLNQSLNELGVPVRHFSYDANPFRVLQRLAGFRIAFSMRPQFSMLAYISETPVLSINFDQSCEQWCKRVGMKSAMTLSEEEVTQSRLEKIILNGLEYGFELPTLEVKKAINASLENWR